MRILSFLAALAMAIPAAQAEPVCGQSRDDIVFYCKIKDSSREVTVCDLPDDRYLYRYGRPGNAPDLEIRSTKDEVVYTPWNGVGSAIWARLGFRNEGYLYDVGWAVQKGGEHPPEGFLDIYEPGNDTPIATKICETGTVYGDLDGLWDRFE